MADSNHVEIERKTRVTDLDAIRTLLRERGGSLLKTENETNLVFDDDSQSLRRGHRLLRLRLGQGAELTYKEPSDRPETGLNKQRREIETSVSSFENTQAILEALGYTVSDRYEKSRESWRYGGCTVCLDELWFGRFVEVEGAPTAIDRVAGDLGLDPASSTRASYIELQAAARRGV